MKHVIIALVVCFAAHFVPFGTYPAMAWYGWRLGKKS